MGRFEHAHALWQPLGCPERQREGQTGLYEASGGGEVAGEGGLGEDGVMGDDGPFGIAWGGWVDGWMGVWKIGGVVVG